MNLDNIEFNLNRIADALERIARHLEGEVLAPAPAVTAYEAAVQALVDMPNDELPEPEKPPVNKDDVIAALNKAGRKHGIDTAKRVLASYGARLDDVDPAKYRGLVDVLGAL